MMEWWQTIDVSNQPAELQQMLAGIELPVGSDERGDERIEKIAMVQSLGVGFDANGMFGFVNVICESETLLVLYTDGAVHDADDVKIGSHDLMVEVGHRSKLVRKRWAG